jgi:phage regulator Rha-like protein
LWNWSQFATSSEHIPVFKPLTQCQRLRMKTKTRKFVIVASEPVEGLIHLVRGQRVIPDSDLAKVYGVTTTRLNQQVRRNADRFPADFAFQVTADEFAGLMLQIATSKKGRGGRRKLPLVFTEHGAIMAANVLNSPRAVQMSVFVVRAFVKMREALSQNRHLAEKLAELERRLTGRLDVHEQAIVHILDEIKKLMEPLPPRWNRSAGKLDFMFGMKPCQNFTAAGDPRARAKRRRVTSLRQKKVRAFSRRLLH